MDLDRSVNMNITDGNEVLTFGMKSYMNKSKIIIQRVILKWI